MNMQKLSFLLIALWVASLIGAYFDLLPREVELGGIVLGAIGLGLMWLPRLRKPKVRDE